MKSRREGMQQIPVIAWFALERAAAKPAATGAAPRIRIEHWRRLYRAEGSEERGRGLFTNVATGASRSAGFLFTGEVFATGGQTIAAF